MDNEGSNTSATLPADTPDYDSPEARRARRLANLRPFVKGDVRINRKGRPKTFDEWRALVQEILQEPAIETDRDGRPRENGKLTLIRIPKVDKEGLPVVDEFGQPVLINHYATNAEMLARKWMASTKRQQDLVDAGYGKVPNAIDITSGGQSLVSQMPDDERMKRLQALTRKMLTDGNPTVPDNVSDNIVDGHLTNITTDIANDSNSPIEVSDVTPQK